MTPMSAADSVCIRGRKLTLSTLVNRKLYDVAYLKALRAELSKAEPFAHLVTEGIFNEVLLDLVHEEFDSSRRNSLEALHTSHESTYRSHHISRMGPATQLYFAVVNSGWFVDVLSFISEIDDLMPDVTLFGGGMHETRAGGRFDVHRDFDRHPRTGLLSEMVFITYLNRNWNPEWKGALELWNVEGGKCVSTILPEFGRSLLMKRTANSFHGHPGALKTPDGVSRRSVASYYYSNPEGLEARCKSEGAAFAVRKPIDRVKNGMRMWVPPIIWSALRKNIGK